jgi:hypothetical protein
LKREFRCFFRATPLGRYHAAHRDLAVGKLVAQTLGLLASGLFGVSLRAAVAEFEPSRVADPGRNATVCRAM